MAESKTRGLLLALGIVVLASVVAGVWLAARTVGKPSQPKGVAAVMVTVEVGDDLDGINLESEPVGVALRGLSFGPAERPALVTVTPALEQALFSGEPPDGFVLGEGLRRLEDLSWIVVERLRFVGLARRLSARRAFLGVEALAPPPHETTTAVEIAEGAVPFELFRAIPWPEPFSWQLTNGPRLVLQAGEFSATLSPGQEVPLPELTEGIDVVWHDRPPPAASRFTAVTRISVRFLGRLELERTE